MKRNQRGAHLVEYLLLLAAIAICVLVAVRLFGTSGAEKSCDGNKTLAATYAISDKGYFVA